MRVGIVGAGSMGNAHAAGWRAAGAEITAVTSLDELAAQRLAGAWGASAVADFEALLPQVDVVDLCVPSDLHAQMTIRAAELGKHVVCEKPIALTVADAEAMVAACERAGVRLFVAHVVRFFPQYRAAAQAVQAGKLGQLGVLRLRRLSYAPRRGETSWFADEARSGGIVLDLMIHDLDYASWLAGPATQVFAASVKTNDPSAPCDYVQATVRFEGGAMALVEAAWAYPPGLFRTGFDLAGTDGLIEWDSDSTESIHRALHAGGTGAAAEVGLPLTVMAEDPYTTEIKHACDALRHDQPFDVTPQEATAALQLGLAVRASLRSGKSVVPAEVT